MPSYRFCRPDDLIMLVRAMNTCYLMHYPDEPAMTAERLKEQMTVLGVRPGNCMVALERQQPVGVVVSTKRDTGVWIQAVGCQPAVQRQGIATELLEALIRKIAIQRAPEVTVDVPSTNTAALRLFEAAGLTDRGRWVSYHGPLPEGVGAFHRGPGPLLQDRQARVDTVPVPDVLADLAAWETHPVCWERNAASLAGYGTVPQGAVYTAQGVRQGVLVHQGPAILALAVAPEADTAQILPALLGGMHAAGFTHASLAKLSDADPLGPALTSLGWTPTTTYLHLGRVLNAA